MTSVAATNSEVIVYNKYQIKGAMEPTSFSDALSVNKKPSESHADFYNKIQIALELTPSSIQIYSIYMMKAVEPQTCRAKTIDSSHPGHLVISAAAAQAAQAKKAMLVTVLSTTRGMAKATAQIAGEYLTIL